MGGRPLRSVKDLAEQWSLLTPGIAAIGIYSLVYLESRYIGAFVVVLLMGIACAVRLPDSQESRRIMTCVTTAMVLVILSTVIASSVLAASLALRDRIRQDSLSQRYWQVANSLNRIGLQSGDRVAVIGSLEPAMHSARLGRFQIVAHLPDTNNFWASDALVKSQVINAFANTGAKVIVAAFQPSYASTRGWQRIGNTGLMVHVLRD
jgi:hypothetical protein